MMIRGGRRVLVFSAHAADFCSRAGGAIIRLVQAGSTVLVYDMTYGEKCESPALWERNPRPTIDEVKKIRWEEMQAAAAVLGATIACLDFEDSPLIIGTDRREQLLGIFREFQPDLVLTHWKDDILYPGSRGDHGGRLVGQRLLLQTRHRAGSSTVPGAGGRVL